MKQTFTTLTQEQQKNFGDGCSSVPDFMFTADCRHHDFNYSRGGTIKDKFKADIDLFRFMLKDSILPWQYGVSLVYFLGLVLLPFSYFHFTYGKYRELEDILTLDKIKKKYK